MNPHLEAVKLAMGSYAGMDEDDPYARENARADADRARHHAALKAAYHRGRHAAKHEHPHQPLDDLKPVSAPAHEHHPFAWQAGHMLERLHRMVGHFAHDEEG